MAAHSLIVGGSSAKRVIACPRSVALSRQVPPQGSSSYADEGTLLHEVMSLILTYGDEPEDYLGRQFADAEVTQDLIEDKLKPALAALDEIDPQGVMDFMVEIAVSYEPLLPGVFGSADLIGRIGKTAYVLDWKFGSGVMVDAEENYQGLFYAGAAMRTKTAARFFDGCDEIKIVIVQPPNVSIWTTTPARVAEFERELVLAVKKTEMPDALLASGEHCRWCRAKPVCPLMNGDADRALLKQVRELDGETVGAYLAKADLLDGWIKDLRATARTMLEQGQAVPGYKLVPKRAMRQWSDPGAVPAALKDLGLEDHDMFETKLRSPTQTEKVLKLYKLALPDDLVISVSSGTTLAPESDPRPSVDSPTRRLAAALAKVRT